MTKWYNKECYHEVRVVESCNLRTHLSICFAETFVDLPDELGAGAGDLFSNFKVLRNRVVVVGVLRWCTGGATFELGKHGRGRHNI